MPLNSINSEDVDIQRFYNTLRTTGTIDATREGWTSYSAGLDVSNTIGHINTVGHIGDPISEEDQAKGLREFELSRTVLTQPAYLVPIGKVMENINVFNFDKITKKCVEDMPSWASLYFCIQDGEVIVSTMCPDEYIYLPLQMSVLDINFLIPAVSAIYYNTIKGIFEYVDVHKVQRSMPYYLLDINDIGIYIPINKINNFNSRGKTCTT